MDRLILNCDLGENEPLDLTKRLLQQIDAANICCGVHAGSPAKTVETLRLAKEEGVLVGAHPGMAANGGRGGHFPSATKFEALLRKQMDRFQKSAKDIQVDIAYVKLHGTLYHAVEVDVQLRERYLSFLKRRFPQIGVFCLAGGRVSADANRIGLKVFNEVFADRAYEASGSLTPRSNEGSVLGADNAIARIKEWRLTGRMPTRDGEKIELTAETLCVHGDTENALEIISRIRAELSAK